MTRPELQQDGVLRVEWRGDEPLSCFISDSHGSCLLSRSGHSPFIALDGRRVSIRAVHGSPALWPPHRLGLRWEVLELRVLEAGVGPSEVGTAFELHGKFESEPGMGRPGVVVFVATTGELHRVANPHDGIPLGQTPGRVTRVHGYRVRFAGEVRDAAEEGRGASLPLLWVEHCDLCGVLP